MEILGHEIKLSRDFDSFNKEDQDQIIETINDCILFGKDEGCVHEDEFLCDWEIVYPDSYLVEKATVLENKEEVVFEYNQLIYRIILRSDEDYEYSYYNMLEKNFSDGDCLKSIDGGICTGSAMEAVFTAVGE